MLRQRLRTALPSPAVLFFAFGGLLLALTVLGMPDDVQVCEPDYETGKRECRYAQLIPGVLWKTLSAINANQGFFTVLLTGVLAALAYRQWKTSEGQRLIAGQQRTISDQQRELMDNQNTIMNGQTNLMLAQGELARQTVREMDETKERSLRAYLDILPEEIRIVPVGNGTRIEKKAIVTNRGQTPAYNLVVAVELKHLPAAFPADPLLDEKPSRGVLAPQAYIAMVPDAGHLTVANEDLDLRAKRVYFFGYVLYEDAFRKRWRQRFCYYRTRIGSNYMWVTGDTWNDEVCIGGQPGHEIHHST